MAAGLDCALSHAEQPLICTWLMSVPRSKSRKLVLLPLKATVVRKPDVTTRSSQLVDNLFTYNEDTG